MLGVFFLRFEPVKPSDDADLLPEEIALYDTVTLRRPFPSLPDRPIATQIQTIIRRYHWLLLAILSAGALVASVITIAARGFRFDLRHPFTAALLLISAAIASRIAFLTVIDATSWPVAFDRFLYPVMPLATALLLAVIWSAAALRGTRAGDKAWSLGESNP